MDKKVIFPSSDLVIGFPIVGDDVLLSIRRRNPWFGCYSGLGGNVEAEDRDLFDAMKREAKQEAEILVMAHNMEKRGEFRIFREGKPMVTLHVFLIYYFEGKPAKTLEMGPHDLFPIANPPVREMITGDEKWFPQLLEGRELLTGEIYRSADLETLMGIDIGTCAHFPRSSK